MTAHRLAYDLGKMGELADPGNAKTVDVTGRSGMTIGFETTSGVETRTLTAPTKAGQTLFMYYKTDSGTSVEIDCINAVSGTDTKLVFDAVGDSALLISHQLTATTYNWRVMAGISYSGTA